MKEFWEEAFREKQEMWGFEPAACTLLVRDFFVKQGIKNILIPGIGYGRNAQVFIENGITVSGIEISETAIDLAQKRFGKSLTMYHGSVTQMPFSKELYCGIYCYALIHLLDKKERKKFIQDCYNQLEDNGCMVFAVVTKDASIYAQGTCIEKERYALPNGVNMFFYNEVSIREEFGQVGLFEVTEVMDIYPFYLIKCKKREE